MRKGQKFTPINISFIRELCLKYGLVEDNCDMERGDFLGNSSKSIASFGITKELAGVCCCPTVVLWDDGDFQLMEDPYIARNWKEDRSLLNYYMEPGGSIHYISSMERFEKFLIEAVERFKETKEELDIRNASLKK